MVPLATNGTIGLKPENSERFSVANGTIGANVTIGQNVSTNGTIGPKNMDRNGHGPKWSWAEMVWAEMVMGRND